MKIAPLMAEVEATKVAQALSPAQLPSNGIAKLTCCINNNILTWPT